MDVRRLEDSLRSALPAAFDLQSLSPSAPVVVGLILGPIAESQLRRALAISLGDPMTLLQSPMSATLLGIALIALLAPFVLNGLGRFKASED
jgi:putative tricarboxylic transport membrane protein